MSLTIDSGQLTLSKRPGIACFPLITLETFSDRDARTVSNTYYWTRNTTIIADTGSVHSFSPVLVGISAIVRGFSHLPDQDEYSTREGMRFALDATPQAGAYVWQDLLAENVIGARVTIESFFVDMSSFATNPRWFDLSSLGHVSIPRWRGEITNLPTLSADASTFELVAESEEVRLQSTRVMTGVITAHEEDLGMPYPVPLGTQFVKPLWYDAGLVGSVKGDWVSTDVTHDFYVDTDKWEQLTKHYDHFDRVQPASVDNQIDSGYITVNGVASAYRTATIDAVDGHVTLTNISTGGRSDNPDGAVAIFTPYATRFAVSGGPISSIGSFIMNSPTDNDVTYDASDGWVTGFWLENLSNGDDGGHVAIVSAFGGHGITASRLADKDNSSLLVEVGGTYSVGSSSSVFQAIGSDASNWAGLGQTGGNAANEFDNTIQSAVNGTGLHEQIDFVTGGFGSITDSSGEMALTINADACRSTLYQRDFATAKSGPVELEFTIEILSADLTDIRRLLLYTNIKTFFGFAFKDVRVLDATDLVAGDNVLRMQAWSDDIDDVGIYVVWNSHVRNRTVTIKSDILSYPITLDSPAGAHPIDVVEQVVDTFLPTSAVTADSTTFATAKTNTPDLAVSLDLSAYPTLGEFLSAIGFNSRINFVLSETNSGTVLKAFAAETDYDFPASAIDIGSEFTNLKVTYRTLSEIATRFVALYDLSPGGGIGKASDYMSTITANEVVNDLSSKVLTSLIISRQADFGKRDAVTIPFSMLIDSTVVTDVFGYYVNESLRGQVARYSCLLPWWIGYDLEPGDILSILPPWETTNQKVRLLQTVFNFDENGIGVVLESVT